MLFPFIAGIFFGAIIAVIIFLAAMYCDFLYRSKINSGGILPTVKKRIAKQGEIIQPLSPIEQSIKDSRGREVMLEDLI